MQGKNNKEPGRVVLSASREIIIIFLSYNECVAIVIFIFYYTQELRSICWPFMKIHKFVHACSFIVSPFHFILWETVIFCPWFCCGWNELLMSALSILSAYIIGCTLVSRWRVIQSLPISGHKVNRNLHSLLRDETPFPGICSISFIHSKSYIVDPLPLTESEWFSF